MAWQALLPAALPIVTSLLGQGQAAGARTDAENARKEALSQFANIKAPTVEEQLLALQQYQEQGVYNPLLEQLIQQEDSRLAGVQLDPRLQAEQLSALEQISGLATGQVKPGDLAAFELARRNAAGEAQAKQGQILQEMQARGQGGSGAELLARLQAAQSGADRLSQAQMQEAQAMQNARMQALQQQANVAGNIRQQSYGEQSDLARARDMINQFNAQNSQGVQSRNVGTQNTAQLKNLTNKQDIANANVDIANKQQAANKGLIQQRYENELNRARGTAGQYSDMAQASDKQAGQTAGMYGTIGQGLGGMVSAFGNSKDTKDDGSGEYGVTGGKGQNDQR